MNKLKILSTFLVFIAVAAGFVVNQINLFGWGSFLLLLVAGGVALFPVEQEQQKIYTALAVFCSLLFEVISPLSGFISAIFLGAVLLLFSMGINFILNRREISEASLQEKTNIFFSVYLGTLIGGAIFFISKRLEVVWFATTFLVLFFVAFFFPFFGHRAYVRNILAWKLFKEDATTGVRKVWERVSPKDIDRKKREELEEKKERRKKESFF